MTPQRTSPPLNEGAEAVARAVAALLDAAPTPEERELPRSLQEVSRLRAATRRIMESRLAPPDEDRMLRALGRQAVRVELPELALAGIVAEVRGPDLPPLPPAGYEQAQDRMRRAGFQRCPACASRLLSEPELDYLRRRRQWASEDQARWEQAAR